LVGLKIILFLLLRYVAFCVVLFAVFCAILCSSVLFCGLSALYSLLSALYSTLLYSTLLSDKQKTRHKNS